MEGARDGWHEDRSEGQEEQGGRWREEGDRPRREEPVARSQGCDTEGQGFGSREGRQGHPQDHEIAPRRRTPALHTRDPSWVHLQLQRLPEEGREPHGYRYRDPRRHRHRGCRAVAYAARITPALNAVDELRAIACRSKPVSAETNLGPSANIAGGSRRSAALLGAVGPFPVAHLVGVGRDVGMRLEPTNRPVPPANVTMPLSAA